MTQKPLVRKAHCTGTRALTRSRNASGLGPGGLGDFSSSWAALILVVLVVLLRLVLLSHNRRDSTSESEVLLFGTRSESESGQLTFQIQVDSERPLAFSRKTSSTTSTRAAELILSPGQIDGRFLTVTGNDDDSTRRLSSLPQSRRWQTLVCGFSPKLRNLGLHSTTSCTGRPQTAGLARLRIRVGGHVAADS